MKISIVLAALTGMFETDLARASKTTEKRMKQIRTEAEKAGKALGVALAAGATAAAVAIKAAIDRADELSKAAQKIGITTEALSALAYAAELADVDLGTLQAGLGKLTKFQSDAAQGTEKNIALFDALGISFRNIDGTLRNTEDVFRDFSNVFATLPDGASKTALALDVFGRSGANLIPLLNEGAAGLDAMKERAEELGIILSTETGQRAEEFNDQLSDMKLAVTGLATSVAAELLPDLVRMNDGFLDATTTGDGFKSTATQIAEAIRGVAEVATTAFQTVRAMTLGIVGMTAAMGEFLATYTLAGRMATTAEQRAAMGNLSSVALSGASDARDRVLNGPAPGVNQPGGAIQFIDPPAAKASAAAIAEVTNQLDKYYGSADAAKAATKALADAQRAAREADREAARRQKEEAEAAKKLAEQVYEQRKELMDLRAEEIKQMQEAKDLVDQVLADIAFETKALGLNNLEREKAVALRYANVDAASKEGQAISAALDDWNRAREIAEGMDILRGATEDLFSDLMSGAKSAKEAFQDFADSIIDNIARMLAKQWTEQLFGSFGSSGTGSSGGFFASLLGGLFGGGKAAGGPVSAGVPYLVGERGPELIIPKASGTVIPARQTASILRGGGVSMVFNVQGSMSKRSQDRARIEHRWIAQKESARTS